MKITLKSLREGFHKSLELLRKNSIDADVCTTIECLQGVGVDKDLPKEFNDILEEKIQSFNEQFGDIVDLKTLDQETVNQIQEHFKIVIQKVDCMVDTYSFTHTIYPILFSLKELDVTELSVYEKTTMIGFKIHPSFQTSFSCKDVAFKLKKKENGDICLGKKYKKVVVEFDDQQENDENE